MSEVIVINTGPLISLSRINALDIVGKLPFRFVCPNEVWDELEDGIKAGYDPISPNWLQIFSLNDRLSAMLTASLDRGEAAVIQLAIERNVSRVCIDEWKGRRAALAAGLKVTGVLGLLGRAKKIGIIQELKPFIQNAIDSGIRYDRKLVEKVLNAANESFSH